MQFVWSLRNRTRHSKAAFYLKNWKNIIAGFPLAMNFLSPSAGNSATPVLPIVCFIACVVRLSDNERAKQDIVEAWMILGSRQQIIYDTIKELCRIRAVAPTIKDVSRRSHYRPSEVKEALRLLIKKGFVSEDRFGCLVANQEPHKTVIRDTLERTKISFYELVGPTKTIHLVRARRHITRTLHLKYGYSCFAIAEILHRHRNTIVDYVDTDKTIAKAKARYARLYSHTEQVAA
jgi:hypothetical protein